MVTFIKVSIAFRRVTARSRFRANTARSIYGGSATVATIFQVSFGLAPLRISTEATWS